MAKPVVSREGAAPGTEYLAVARVADGKMVILGDLELADDRTRSKLEAVIRDSTSPGNPMHLLHIATVTVVSRCLQLEGEYLAPSIRQIEE